MVFPNKPTILWLPRTEISGWLFFFFFVALASVRAKAASADSDADDALSDFTNDLFTDLGPLLALFGEQMTKQYISESTTFYDYFIFDDFQVAIKDLWEIHWRLQYCRTYFGRKIEPVYDTLLEALVKKDRFATLYFLAKVALNPLSAQEMDSASAALPLAAKYGWFEAVDALLNMGFDPLAEDEAGRTALGYCAEYAKFEHEACAEVFLSHERALDASKSASWSGDDGRTPLLWAVTHGHEGMVRIFVRKGFPLVEQGSGRLSPLTEAVSKGFEEIALQLIDAGTELRKKHLALANLDNSLQGPVTACLRAQIVEFGDYWSQQMLEIIVDNDFDALQLLFNLGIRVEFRQVVLAVRTGHQEVKQLFLGEFPGWVAANPEDTKEGLSKLESDNDWYIMQVLLDHGGSAVYAGFQA
ncbi:putative ankyrin repeat protein [Colletotrichum siamense]|nr:putative ankyrin repeat protein [Colletotrichum siamense]